MHDKHFMSHFKMKQQDFFILAIILQHFTKTKGHKVSQCNKVSLVNA